MSHGQDEVEDEDEDEALDTGRFEETPGMERRVVLRVLKYWRHLAGDRAFPSVHDLDAAAAGDLWAQCFVLQLGRHRNDPVFRYCGDGFTRPPGAMLKQTRVSALPQNALITHALNFMGEVLRKEVPITRGGRYVDPDGRTIDYRSILLPLSSDDRSIDFLLGAANSSEVG